MHVLLQQQQQQEKKVHLWLICSCLLAFQVKVIATERALTFLKSEEVGTLLLDHDEWDVS